MLRKLVAKVTSDTEPSGESKGEQPESQAARTHLRWRVERCVRSGTSGFDGAPVARGRSHCGAAVALGESDRILDGDTCRVLGRAGPQSVRGEEEPGGATCAA